jgi:hypothetical protein
MIENSVTSCPPCWGAGRKGAAHFAVQRAARPQPAGLVELEVGALGNRLRNRLGHALYVDLRARASRAFCDCLGHLLDVSVGGIVENEDLGHGMFPFQLLRG